VRAQITREAVWIVGRFGGETKSPAGLGVRPGNVHTQRGRVRPDARRARPQARPGQGRPGAADATASHRGKAYRKIVPKVWRCLASSSASIRW
jgi:hypothetical protein